MLFLQRIPKLLRWIFSVVLIFILTMSVFRLIFFWTYNPPGKAFSGSAFIMGIRFDAKFACMLGLAMLILCALPFLNPFKNFAAKKFWNFLITVVFIVTLIFYGADYFHYDYLHQRLNASALFLLQNRDSFTMMWQSYPIIKIIIILLILIVLARLFFGWLLAKFQAQDSYNKRKGIIFYILGTLILAQVIIGKVVVMPGQFPLRWSDAYTLSDDFKANLALNPFQSFFSTLSFRSSSIDIKKVRELYPEMAAQMGVQWPDSIKLNYERTYSFPDSATAKPNVVFVICESFSGYKSSMYGNPLNTTPFFADLCKKGVFFDRCFTPSYGTARGVWAAVTGIPDVESPKTASRNPNAVDQHTIMSDLKSYQPFYFLGGDPTWANIQGVMANNIPRLKFYMQNDYKADKVDVWGISDKNLFLEANGILAKQTAPFFAIIQTADNHRPYTIPTEDQAEFKKVNFPADSLSRYGFENNEELNAFRYTDFCYQKFMEAAQKEAYFKNTIFVFIGDHGISGNAGNMFPKAWTDQNLTNEHVPLLFYAPGLLQPKQMHDVCSQVDVMPTIAALTKSPYTNTTFGRNLLDTFNNLNTLAFALPDPQSHYAFIYDDNARTIGLISNQYYFLKSVGGGKEQFVSVINNDKIPVTPETENEKATLSKLTDAYYETAKYLMLNNKKKQ